MVSCGKNIAELFGYNQPLYLLYKHLFFEGELPNFQGEEFQ